MITQFVVRPLERADLASLVPVLDSTGLFPADMLPAMAEPFLTGAAAHHWLVVVDPAAGPVGFAYAEPERMTDRTVNLLAIAVHADRHGEGLGRALVESLDERLRAAGERLLIVETSGLGGFAGTRAFYHALGFVEEATIRDFYADGDDKRLFWKRLRPPA